MIRGFRKSNGNDSKVEGLGGSFSYVRLGKPLFGEYRNFGDENPPYDELAKYVFYTETSQEFDPKAVKKKTGRIGEYKGTAYYLLYTPEPDKDKALDLEWLKTVAAGEKCRKLVVYCEKLWLHRDELHRWEAAQNKKVRPMIVPFQLR